MLAVATSLLLRPPLSCTAFRKQAPDDGFPCAAPSHHDSTTTSTTLIETLKPRYLSLTISGDSEKHSWIIIRCPSPLSRVDRATADFVRIVGSLLQLTSLRTITSKRHPASPTTRKALENRDSPCAVAIGPVRELSSSESAPRALSSLAGD